MLSASSISTNGRQYCIQLPPSNHSHCYTKPWCEICSNSLRCFEIWCPLRRCCSANAWIYRLSTSTAFEKLCCQVRDLSCWFFLLPLSHSKTRSLDLPSLFCRDNLVCLATLECFNLLLKRIKLQSKTICLDLFKTVLDIIFLPTKRNAGKWQYLWYIIYLGRSYVVLHSSCSLLSFSNIFLSIFKNLLFQWH